MDPVGLALGNVVRRIQWGEVAGALGVRRGLCAWIEKALCTDRVRGCWCVRWVWALASVRSHDLE